MEPSGAGNRREGPEGGIPYATPFPFGTEADIATTRPASRWTPFWLPRGRSTTIPWRRRFVAPWDTMACAPRTPRTIAAHVLNFFGFNERIIDNVLEPDDRDTFYMLEDTGILETERDETTLYDGREWRIHYWMFRKDRIFDLAREESQAMAEAGEKDVVYYLGRRAIGRIPAPPRRARYGMAAHAVYHELGDEIWLERRRPPPRLPVRPHGGPQTASQERALAYRLWESR